VSKKRAAASLAEVVNVASVPQRSLFRYPGGKTWLVPRARLWLESQPKTARLLVEPFAGGGIIGLTAMFEGLAEHVLFVELDPIVAAVWRVLADGDGPRLAQRIVEFECTRENVVSLMASEVKDDLDQAFLTIVRNRTTRGGILAVGAGLIKDGENGKGITSRWYPDTLARRINDIHEIRDRMTVVVDDGLAVIAKHLDDPDAVFFVDPPYTAGGKNAGSRLYGANDLDHSRLFDLCASARGDFLMTYDNSVDVELLAASRGLAARTVAMKNTHHAAMTELLIGRDLSWLPAPAVAVPDTKAA
jgi:DNA adenine methylase